MSKLRSSFAALAAATALCAALTVAPDARAHFVLEEPPAATVQDGLGNPQKQPPCGGGTATGIVSAYAVGSTITITIDETITHPGHYRVALGMNGPGDLPDEPPVTAGDTPCGSTVIQDPPVFPVLADGQLLHTGDLGGPKSFEVTLPAGVTCDNCTLQILEFMSDHQLNNPGGCFYHHCANITVGDGPPTSVTTAGPGSSSSGAGPSSGSGSSSKAGSGSGTGSGGSGGGGSDGTSSGCSCSTAGDLDATPGLGALALGLVAVAWRRRRSRARASGRRDAR